MQAAPSAAVLVSTSSASQLTGRIRSAVGCGTHTMLLFVVLVRISFESQLFGIRLTSKVGVDWHTTDSSSPVVRME